MTTALDHPLVARYLRELDAALASLPAPAASELSEQIRAHLVEALPPEADEPTVAAVLDALGPASLVAAAASSPGGGAGRDPLLRRVIRRARRLPKRAWLAIAGVVIAIGVLIYWEAQTNLSFGNGAYGWWSPLDSTHEVRTEAIGFTQDTVPIRPGKIQGYVIMIWNYSDVSQRVLGSTDEIGLGGGRLRIAVSTAGPLRTINPTAVSYRSTGIIPPHQYRWVRVLWRSQYGQFCPGCGAGTHALDLRVQIGLIIRTEVIQLPTEFALVAPQKASSRRSANPAR